MSSNSGLAANGGSTPAYTAGDMSNLLRLSTAGRNPRRAPSRAPGVTKKRAPNGCVDIPASMQDDPTKPHALVTSLDKLWDAPADISYSFMGGEANQQQKFREVVTIWESFSQVKFVEETEDATQAEIRISFNSSDGSWSYVGKDSLAHSSPQATMNFGWVYNTPGLATPAERGVILHEVGHALGLRHEHQSPARSGIFLDEHAVIDFYTGTSVGWSAEQVRTQILQVYNSSELSSYSEWDQYSIMQYPVPRELTKDGKDVEFTSDLSDMDKAYITINYPRLDDNYEPDFTKEEWSLEIALDIAGVNGAYKAKILALFHDDKLEESEKVRKIRVEFSSWSMAARKKASSADPKVSVAPGESGASEVARSLENIRRGDGRQHQLGPAGGAASSLSARAVQLRANLASSAVQDVIAGALAGAFDAHALTSGAARGLNPNGPDAGIRDIVNHPVFKKILVGALSGAIEGIEGSIPPSKATANGASAALPDAGILDFIRSVATNPVVGQVVSGAVSGVLDNLLKGTKQGQADRAIQPAQPSSTSAVSTAKTAIGVQRPDGTWQVLAYVSGADVVQTPNFPAHALPSQLGDNGGDPEHFLPFLLPLLPIAGKVIAGVLGNL